MRTLGIRVLNPQASAHFYLKKEEQIQALFFNYQWRAQTGNKKNENAKVAIFKKDGAKRKGKQQTETKIKTMENKAEDERRRHTPRE